MLSGSNPLPEQATITVYLYDSGFGYSNSYGVNSTVPGQQNTLQAYTFTVTSGNPQLDPTFFQLSAEASLRTALIRSWMRSNQRWRRWTPVCLD